MTNSLSVATALRSLESEPTPLDDGALGASESFQAILPNKYYVLMTFDQLFIGAADLERGTTTFNEWVRLSQVMAEVLVK